jgi:hypothetical protein
VPAPLPIRGRAQTFPCPTEIAGPPAGKNPCGTWHNQWRALFKGYAFAQARDIRLYWERLRSLGVLALLHEGGKPEVPKVIPAPVIDLVREVERKVGPIGRRGF